MNAGIRARIDEREGMTPGFKFNDWEMRGVPVRIEIGPRDVASGEAVLARRDKSGPESKSKASLAAIADAVTRAARRDSEKSVRAGEGRDDREYAKVRRLRGVSQTDGR